MAARRIGLSVILIERGSHPRFAIGESTAPLTNLLIESLARRYDLPNLLPLTTYGKWLEAYPGVMRGIKRGFTFYSHRAGERFAADSSGGARHSDRGANSPPERCLFVAASPSDRVADTHWLRADVDHFLVREAAAAGAEYLDLAAIETLSFTGGCAALEGSRAGRRLRIRARLLVDASGPRGFLSRALALPEAPFAGYPPTQGLYTHFQGARRCEELPEFAAADAVPYRPDDAALHHVFEGGWIWVLRFDNGVTSAGIAATDELAGELQLSEGAAAWRRALARYPSIADQFTEAEAIRPFAHAPQLSYRTSRCWGEGWTMLPSAAAFVDPLFSTGMPLALLGVERLAMLLERYGAGLPADALAEYGETTFAEADWTASYLRAAYATLGRFELFAPLSMFYFAAASYAEMARRLDSKLAPRRFLAADHEGFALGMRRCEAVASAPSPPDAAAYARLVAEAIDPLNIAGMCDPARRNRYPVLLDDVIANAAKLGFTPEGVRSITATAEWARA